MSHLAYNTDLDQSERKLAPTISQVKNEGHKLLEDQKEYKDLLRELAQSDFVQHMKAMQHDIID